MLRYRQLLLVTAATVSAVITHAQSIQTVSTDENFRSLVETTSRVLGLDDSNDVLVSLDSGASFSALSTLSTDPIDIYYSMAAIGDTVVAVGTDGLIARSANEGTSWTASVNTDFISGDLRTVSGQSNSPNVWLAAGGDLNDGVILMSSDDGATWAESTSIADLGFSGSVWTGSAWLVCGLDELLFEGVMYRSTDGSVWSAVTLPTLTEPLLGLAADGAGNVVAVGERGTVLYSSDHGESFVQLGAGLLDEDLIVAVATGVNQFVIGGSGKSLLQTQGTSLSILRDPIGGAPDVEALLLTGSSVLVGGSFSSAVERTIPLDLGISVNESGFRLAIGEGLPGKVYTLQTSTDLNTWNAVEDSSLIGTGGLLEWIETTDGPKRFWRVEEF